MGEMRELDTEQEEEERQLSVPAFVVHLVGSSG
jgi:hypothetical protein